MKKLILFLILLQFGTAFAQKTHVPGKPEENGVSPERLKRIDQMLSTLVAEKKIPGAVALIVRNGKIIYHQSFGFSDMESKTTLKKNDIFRIASMSKAITSLAAMMLFEEGKFQLDDPVSRFIPEFRNPNVLVRLNWSDTTWSTVPAKSELTIRQLLTHTSGIDYAAIGNQEFKAIYAKAGVPSGIGNDRDRIADKIKILGSLPLRHNPGEQYTYGLNTDVLGYLIEVLSGQTFDEFLRARIFTPLGMNDTYFYLPKEKHTRLVRLYETKNNALNAMKGKAYDGVDPDYPTLPGSYYSGGAGLSSTVEDYAKFLQLFLNKGEYNGVRLLSRKTVELMLTNQIQPPLTQQFGLGFGLETEKNDHQSVLSLGSFSWGGAFNTHYWADPKEKLIGILFTNMYASQQWSIGDRYKVMVYQSIND